MITIVSGLPRCGTSMMMQMLHAGGMDVLTDHVRQADSDNPKGYYELEKVKKVRENSSWLDEAEGKVFKAVSMLLFDMPKDRRYQIVFMERQVEEILASQAVMLDNLGQAKGADDKEMRRYFEQHLGELKPWIARQSHLDAIFVPYHGVLKDPARQAQRIADFLRLPLDRQAMAAVVDPGLYRQRQAARQNPLAKLINRIRHVGRTS